MLRCIRRTDICANVYWKHKDGSRSYERSDIFGNRYLAATRYLEQVRQAAALLVASLLLAGGSSIVMAVTAGDDSKKELAALEGKWNGVKNVDNNGNVGVKGDPILIEGNKMHVAIRGRVTFIGKIKIDPKVMPKTIDFEYIEGPGGVVGKTKLGIYKLDKDQLEICWNSDGDKERPRKFTTDKLTIGKGFAYFLFARSKE